MSKNAGKLKKPDCGTFRVPGFRSAGIRCGIKKKSGAPDLAVIVSDRPATVAGVFTRNKVQAAPVLFDKKRVRKGLSRGVVVNSGNANACTGTRGYVDTERTASVVEAALGLEKGDLLVCSTGVIGVPLPVKKIEAAAPDLAASLAPDGFLSSARAMMTTDAFPKTAFKRVRIGGRLVTIGGVAKGAGMICPDMATMLAFLATDADVPARTLRKALNEAVEGSFNSISVDNDSSTNDTVLAFASGASKAEKIRPGTEAFRKFTAALTHVASELARMIVMDGEGATRLITIDIKGAASGKEAKKGAMTAATSMLVKTAFFGGDPNWGRVVAALGRAGIKINPDKVDMSLNGVQVVAKGMDTGAEARAARAIKAAEVTVDVDLHIGRGSATVWTSDLSYEYVRINSEYRT